MKAAEDTLPDLIELDPEVLAVDCTAAELPDRRFDLARRGYLITSETATEHSWRISARRCDCDVCTSGRRARTRTTGQEIEQA